jgi:ferric-dicitrate binding protein FerR (iron transport regulator)
LQLLLGKIKAEIQKRTGGSPPFKLGTPSAVITVRGTRFFVQVDKHRVTRVTVEEGVVEVESTKRVGKPVQIKAGFSTRVKEDSDPDPAQEAHGQQRENYKGSQGQRPNSPGPRGRRP